MNYLLFVFSTLPTLFVLSSLGFLLISVILNYLFLAFPFFVWIVIAKGGGILVYAKSSLSPSVIPFDSSPIELLLLSVKLKHTSSTLATFYRPPSSSSGIFSSLQSVLESLPHSISLNLILLGDFNVDFSSPSSSLNLINSISDLFSLNQIVSQPTHFSVSNSPSLIDLVFIPASLPHYSCNVLLPISNSDHNSILLSLRFLLLLLRLPLLLLVVSGYTTQLTSLLPTNFFPQSLGILFSLALMLTLLG